MNRRDCKSLINVQTVDYVAASGIWREARDNRCDRCHDIICVTRKTHVYAMALLHSIFENADDPFTSAYKVVIGNEEVLCCSIAIRTTMDFAIDKGALPQVHEGIS